MAFQLVYTSAPKLLDAGRSGFGTVARSKTISPLLVSAIERSSQFANLRGLDRSRVIYVHRSITAGSSRYHVLTRIVDSGVDYTGRTNHIAHHLVVSQEEASRATARGVTPADVLRQYPWLDRWNGAPRFFDSSEDVPIEIFRCDGQNSGSQYWRSVTGSLSHARLLAWEGAPRAGVLIIPDGVNPLSLMAEALTQCGSQSWSRSFTTSLETTDELSDIDWILSSLQAYPEIQARCSKRTVWDLSVPSSLPVPTAPPLHKPQQEAPKKPEEIMTHAALPHLREAQSCSPDFASVKKSSALSKSRGDDANHSSTRQTTLKKNNLLVRVGACAALVTALIILRLVINSKNDQDGHQYDQSPIEKVADENQEAINKLTKHGELTKQGAEQLINAVGITDSNDYANFINDFIPKIKNINSIDDLEALNHQVNVLESNPDWLNELIKARNLIVEYPRNEYENLNLLRRFEMVREISRHLAKAASSDLLPSFDHVESQSFHENLLKLEMNKFFKTNNHNDKRTFDLIKLAFEELNRSEFKQDFISTVEKTNRPIGIDNYVISLIKEFKDNQNSLREELPDNLKKLEKPIQIQPQKQYPPEKKKAALNTSGLKPYEITLLKDRIELKELTVPILVKIFENDSVAEQVKGLLEIKIDSTVVEKLSKETNKDFYRDGWQPTVNVNKNGKITFIKNTWNTIKIDLTHENKRYCHFIVFSNLESKDDKPVIEEDLIFEMNEHGPDSVKISGQAMESLMGNELSDGLLKFKHNETLMSKGVLDLTGEPKLDNGVLYIRRSPQITPIMVLEDQDAKNLQNKTNEWRKNTNIKENDNHHCGVTCNFLKELIAESVIKNKNKVTVIP